jgi:hypothetical protein
MALPRGCLEEALDLLRSHGVATDIEDLRERGAGLDRRRAIYSKSYCPSALSRRLRRDAGTKGSARIRAAPAEATGEPRL